MPVRMTLSYAALTQIIVEVCAEEGADALLGDEVIAGVLFEFGNKLGPIGWEGEVARAEIGATRSGGGDVNENDRQTAFAEGSGELDGPVDDLRGCVYEGQADDAFLEVDDNEGRCGIELRERHGVPFC